MILRPIVVTLKYTIFRLPLLRFATGLHIESLLVQLSRCRQSVRTAFRFCFQTLKAIQTLTQFLTASDATLCVFVNPRPARLTRSATLLPCFIHLLDGSYGRLSSLPLSIPFPHRIDHRMNPPCFHFGLLLRKEVIQPHLPIRLPCYDFTPVIGLALDG